MVRRLSLLGGVLAATALPLSALAAVTLPDNGSGRWVFPSNNINCYEVCPGFPSFQITDGLPGSTAINIDLRLCSIGISSDGPGGVFGGTTQSWVGTAQMSMTGTGALAAFSRNTSMHAAGTTSLAPHTPFAPNPSLPSDLQSLQGQLFGGDPDFDLLRITAGSLFGLPSPGTVSAFPIAGGNWAVDSFFDIFYRIDFVGAPGGSLAGMSGSTTGQTRVWLVPSPGTGAAALAAAGLAATRRRRRPCQA